jgi:hypothetical protein
MNNKKSSLLLIFVLIIQCSCEKIKDIPERDIVINELMPVNSTVVADQNGEYDDWFEIKIRHRQDYTLILNYHRWVKNLYYQNQTEL